MTNVSSLPPLTWHTLVSTWHVQPVWTLFGVLLLVGYAVGLRICRGHRVPAVSRVRAGLFGSGVALLLVSVSSAIDVYAMAVWWVHMVQHLLLIMVVPALLVLGQPLTLLRAVASTRGRESRVDRVLGSPPVALFTHPVMTMAIYAGVIIGTHLTSFMDEMATHAWLVPAEQVLYLASGYLFLLPLIGNEPIRWHTPFLARIGLVLLGMTPDTIVGIVLLQTDRNMFPVMNSMHPAWAPSPLTDLNIAGGLMWAVGDGLMMLIGVGITVAMISRQSSQSTLGPRLERIRRANLQAQVSRGDPEPSGLDPDGDVDEDDAMLAAYNRMLGRMSGPGGH